MPKHYIDYELCWDYLTDLYEDICCQCGCNLKQNRKVLADESIEEVFCNELCWEQYWKEKKEFFLSY